MKRGIGRHFGLAPRTTRRLLLLALGAGLVAPVSAQPAHIGPARLAEAKVGSLAKPAAPLMRSLPPDRAPLLRLRQPDAGRLRELRQQREFTYVEVLPEAPSAWDLFWRRVGQALREWLSGRSYQGFWRWVCYALIVAAAVFVVLRLLDVELTGVFGRSPRPGPLPYDTHDENIHAVDFQARLAEAEAAGNYRLALRLGYLQLLKQLSDRGLIQWQPDKTNHAYLAELPAGPLRPAFRELTRQFEYVWYGELSLPASLYQQARAGQQALRGEMTS